MALPYGDFSTAVRTRNDAWRPFWNEGDTSTIMTEEEWVQDASNYFPRPLGSLGGIGGNSFLVEEKKPRRIDGGLYKWVRVYSQVPLTRVDYERYVFVTPIMSAVSSPTLVNSTAIGQWTAAVTFINNNTGLTEWGRRIRFNAADIVRLNIKYDYSIGDPNSYNLLTSRLVEVHATDGPGAPGTYIDVRDWLRDLVETPGYYGVELLEVYSGTYVDSTGAAKVVTSEMQYDYFNTLDPSAIPVLEALAYFDASNERTNTLDASSTPTADEYAAWGANGARIVVETSIIRRWKGNIWERRTRYVKATV